MRRHRRRARRSRALAALHAEYGSGGSGEAAVRSAGDYLMLGLVGAVALGVLALGGVVLKDNLTAK